MTTKSSSTPFIAFGSLPTNLRSELIDSLARIEDNFRQGRWEPSELNGGKLCEVVYSIVRGHIEGALPARATKPRNMVDACKALEGASGSFSRSIRIQIPRMIVALYEIRNNRGVGHMGGDVDPNHMDAAAVLSMSRWLVAELVRVLHDLSTTEATAIVEALTVRELPVIWRVQDKRRVLNPRLTMAQKSLLLLYGETLPVKDTVLFDWIEHSNLSDYRRRVLQQLHKDKMVEYDGRTHEVEISPLGVRRVEETILPKLA